MEDSKIRVGITQGDINGVGYEVILKTFADPVMLELCTPIIYGSLRWQLIIVNHWIYLLTLVLLILLLRQFSIV